LDSALRGKKTIVFLPRKLLNIGQITKNLLTVQIDDRQFRQSEKIKNTKTARLNWGGSVY